MELHVGAVLRRAQRALGRVHPAARRDHDARHDDPRRPRHTLTEPGLGIAWDFEAIEAMAVAGSSFSLKE